MLMVIQAQLNYLLPHGLDERDKINADAGSSSARLTYCCTGMMRWTRIMLMMLTTHPYCLLLHGHDEIDKNNTDDGSRSSGN